MWLVNAGVVDVRSATLNPDRSVRVRDGRITDVRTGRPEPAAIEPDEEVVDLSGSVLAPGLVSVHTHLSVVYPFSATDEQENPGLTVVRSLSRAVDALRAGVTTIRSVHEINQADLLLRRACDLGWAEVPRIVGAGRAISTTGGHGQDMGCVYTDGYDGFLAAARAELAAGADHIKVFITGGIANAGESILGAQMTMDEMRGAVRAAQDHHSYVVAHAGDGSAIAEGLQAGIRSFEHAYSLSTEVAAEMHRRQVFLTPTLCVTRCPEWMTDHGFTRDQVERALEVGPGHLESIKRAVDAGVSIVAGTDYPPGEPMDDTVVAVREMEFLAEAGLGPAGALQAATVNAARLLRLDGEIGEVAVGAAADLLVLDADPTLDLRALHAPRMVIHDGQLVRDDRDHPGNPGGGPGGHVEHGVAV